MTFLYAWCATSALSSSMPPTFLDTFIPSKKSLRSWLTGIYWNLVKLNLIDTLFIKRNKPFFHWFLTSLSLGRDFLQEIALNTQLWFVEDVFWLYFAFSLDLKNFWIHQIFQSEIGFVTSFLFFSTIVQCLFQRLKWQIWRGKWLRLTIIA